MLVEKSVQTGSVAGIIARRVREGSSRSERRIKTREIERENSGVKEASSQRTSAGRRSVLQNEERKRENCAGWLCECLHHWAGLPSPAKKAGVK
jgi:hypothetical protein